MIRALQIEKRYHLKWIDTLFLSFTSKNVKQRGLLRSKMIAFSKLQRRFGIEFIALWSYIYKRRRFIRREALLIRKKTKIRIQNIKDESRGWIRRGGCKRWIFVKEHYDRITQQNTVVKGKLGIVLGRRKVVVLSFFFGFKYGQVN